jgi:hypothetical protein
MTYVTHRNNQTRAKIKNLENEQKNVMSELLEIKRIIYGQARKTEETQKEKGSFDTGN